MKLQRSDLVLYGVALLSSLLAVSLVYGYVESRVAEAESKTHVKTVTVIEQPKLRSVVVANRDIYRGEKINIDDVKVLNVPTEGVVASGVVVNPEKIVGRIAKQPIYAGEWLIEKKVGLKDDDEGRVESLLEEGMRAMRIPVSAESGLLGMLNPSDHVDVISVFESADGKRMVSRTILQNIEVLSIGQTNRMGRKNYEEREEEQDNHEGEAFVKASMVALNVNTTQAEQLALAMNVGAIHLALRGPADVALVETDGVNVKVIERSKQRPPKYKAKRNRDVIQIMQGDQVQEVFTQ
ncbi:Flp pilus assembly protein CpaB [Thiomicrorhabdus lithotrophica]|uniref:Flp pilus assembly protein CpaB n=1 Tax=Thiomicrorhabdus lithotrophica TaxID=2949997 RepID=A0ABY8C9C2_9GAMM|nr:Flp pilus assembly protein CpaB [Thiomicrorhabdus lithotrophica]WEJ62573.1 Flp pilus assembly protein CpaB [Thiomicrorhabdus lithotrophica]